MQLFSRHYLSVRSLLRGRFPSPAVLFPTVYHRQAILLSGYKQCLYHKHIEYIDFTGEQNFCQMFMRFSGNKYLKYSGFTKNTA